MIEVRSLTKRYGARVAVDDLSFVVKPGVVTGFLGPNRSGKSTTMRLILGLDAPTGGTALFTATPNPDDHSLAPWAGFAVFCGYTAVLLAGAAVLLLRRDV